MREGLEDAHPGEGKRGVREGLEAPPPGGMRGVMYNFLRPLCVAGGRARSPPRGGKRGYAQLLAAAPRRRRAGEFAP